jgi:hypothetical protein
MLKTQSQLLTDLVETFNDINNKPLSMHDMIWRTFHNHFKGLDNELDKHRTIEINNGKYKRSVLISMKSEKYKVSYMTVLTLILEVWLRRKGYNVVLKAHKGKELLIEINVDYMYELENSRRMYAGYN